MLSDEEKKAIEIVKGLAVYYDDYGLLDEEEIEENEEVNNSIKIVLNLIEKQQKEIDRLQNIKRKDIQDLINNEKENIYKNYISKSKIKAKIERIEDLHIDDGFKYYITNVLQSLLEKE